MLVTVLKAMLLHFLTQGNVSMDTKQIEHAQ